MTTQLASPEAQLIQSVQLALRACQFEKAHWIVEQEHRKDRECPIWKSYRGRLISILKRDFKHGLELCQQAVTAEAYNGQLHANLAWVYFLAGEHGLARESVTEAMKWDERNQDALMVRSRLVKKTRDLAGSTQTQTPRTRRASGAMETASAGGAMGLLRKTLPTFFGRS